MMKLLVVSCLTGAFAVKLADMDQGVAFTKCINNDDFQTKTLHDDITLTDRDGNGCCAAGTIPGAPFKSGYQGAQVVCGINANGAYNSFSVSTSNGVSTCNYRNCYVMKQDITCKDASKQTLSGCCGPNVKALTSTSQMTANLQANCLGYEYEVKDLANTNVKYCATYHKNYGTVGAVGTSGGSDDQANGKLLVDKVRTYAACASSSVGGGGGGGGTPTVHPTPVPTPMPTTKQATASGSVKGAMSLGAIVAIGSMFLC